MPDPNQANQPNSGQKPPENKPASQQTQQAAHEPPKTDSVTKLAETIERLEERTRLAAPAAATPGLDETVPGGRYIVKGRAVNAHGRELNDDGTLKYPEQQQVDAFGRLT